MTKLIKFFIVGGINTSLTIAIFYLLHKISGVNYILASAFGYAVGMINSFILNKRWTFRDTEKKVLSQFLRFISVNLFSMGINLSVLYVLVDRFQFESMFSQVAAIFFSTAANFIGSKLFVFSRSLRRT